MKLKTAFLAALKYTSISLIPTILGFTVTGAGLWFGLVGPLLELNVLSGGLSPQIINAVIATVSPGLVFGGVAGGYFVHRVGRTTLMFKIHGSAVQEDFYVECKTSD